MPRTRQWNGVACPYCKEPSHYLAVKCPHCGSDFSQQEIEVRRGAFRVTSFGCLALIVLVFLAGLILWMAEGTKVSPAPVPLSSPSISPPAPSLRSVEREMDECDAASVAFEKAYHSNIKSDIEVAARAIAPACHNVSMDFNNLNLPAVTSMKMAERRDECSDAYFDPEFVAENWSKAEGSVITDFSSAFADDRRQREVCRAYMKRLTP